MKIFVSGVSGQLGHDVMNELHKRGIDAVGSDIKETYSGIMDGTPVTSMPYVRMDITDPEQVDSVLAKERPDAVIHCAAWTAVDAAEDEENTEKVEKINAQGTRNIARACQKLGAVMMYISTDYIFDGQGETPWKSSCTNYAPLNVYGLSKLHGEEAVRDLLEKYFIVRIAWVFGRNGNNFIRTMLRLGKTHDALRIVNDQIGTPTYTYDLARLLCDMIVTDRYGTYHATNSEVSCADGSSSTAEGCRCGYISWYDFACEIFRQAANLGHPEYEKSRLKVTPVTTAEYGISKAARPFNSRLDKSALTANGFEVLPDWQDALSRYLAEFDFDTL